jgi:DNA repair exonuclease SbcCD ATPase subunit
LGTRIEQYKALIQRKRGQEDTLKGQKAQAETSLAANVERRASIELLQTAIQKAAVDTQARLVLHIESIVNKLLGTVFADTYEFKLDFKVSRGRSEARDAAGGGVSDVAAIALRLACWSLSDAPRVLLLDEATKHLSRDLQPRFAEVLKEITSTLGLQVLFVTHSDAVEEIADKQITVKIKGGVSQV